MFLNNPSFISVGMQRAKMYKKLGFPDFTVEAPETSLLAPFASAGFHPYKPALENFLGTRALLS